MSSKTAGSSIVFGDDVTSASINTQKVKPASNTPTSQNVPEASKNDFRSSSRVNHPGGTGGPSQIFANNNAPSEPSRPAPEAKVEDEPSSPRGQIHTSSRVLKPGGTGGPSQIVIGENSSQNHFKSTEDPPIAHQQRSGKGAMRTDANQSQIHMGTDGAPETARSSSRVLRPPGGGSSIHF